MTGQLVSVVIPCFNQAHFLRDCVASLQAQTFDAWEAIIVNDGSPDDTRQVAASLVEHDSRVRYVEKPNGGLSSARNAGVQAASGRWIQFLDADDLIEPRKLELQTNQLATVSKLAFCYCAYWKGDAINPRIRATRTNVSSLFKLTRPVLDMALRWEWDFSIPIHAALFDSRFFRNLEVVFDESLANHEDWDMWMQVLKYAPVIHYIPEELAIYRQSENSMSSDSKRMWQGFSAAIRKQQKAYAKDCDVLLSLEYMQRLINYRYRRTWRAKLRYGLDRNRLYRDNCPWPVQKLLNYLTDRPAPPVYW